MRPFFILCVLLTGALQAQNNVHQATISEAGGQRVIRSNGIPDHPPGAFPNPNNPNSIAPQKYEFRMTLTPKEAAKPTPSLRAFFAVAVNGVPFEPGTAEFWNRDPRSGWVAEAKSGQINLGLDEHQAHVQPTGAYHYHGLPTGLIQRLGGGAEKMLLLGWAADGFPVYAARGHADPKDAASPLVNMRTSWRLKSGKRPDGARGPGGDHDGYYTEDYEYVPGLGDLDECHGRFGVTPEHPQGIYHYYITEEFPYMGRMWKGKADPSFEKQGGPPGGGRGGPPGAGRGRRGGPGFGPGFGPPPGSRPPGGPGGGGPGFGPPPGQGPPGGPRKGGE